MQSIFKSRRFWLLLIDFIAVIGGFVVKQYVPANYGEIVVLVVTAAQPLVMYLLSKFTEDDTVVKVMGKFLAEQSRASSSQVGYKGIHKLTVVLLMLGAVAFASTFIVPVASAQGPLPDAQPWMFPAAEYTGLGTVANVQSAFKRYQDNQAALHQYTTPAMWWLNYDSDVTSFLKAHGCSSCEIVNGVLSYKLRIDIPVAQRDFGIVPQMQ